MNPFFPQDPNVPICDYFETLERDSKETLLPPGAYDLDDLKEFCKARGFCPYFFARSALQQANFVVYR